MFEQQYVLNKIEQWAERLPYRTLRIEVELPGQTLTLETVSYTHLTLPTN